MIQPGHCPWSATARAPISSTFYGKTSSGELPFAFRRFERRARKRLVQTRSICLDRSTAPNSRTGHSADRVTWTNLRLHAKPTSRHQSQSENWVFRSPCGETTAHRQVRLAPSSKPLGFVMLNMFTNQYIKCYFTVAYPSERL